MKVIVVPRKEDMAPHHVQVRDYARKNYHAESAGNDDIRFIHYCVQKGIPITYKEANRYIKSFKP